MKAKIFTAMKLVAQWAAAVGGMFGTAVVGTALLSWELAVALWQVAFLGRKEADLL